MSFVTPERFGALDPHEIAGLSGIEHLERMMDGRFPAPPITKVLNYSLIEASKDGVAVFAGVPNEDYLNPLGTVHGGWAATVLDSALACAVHATLGVGERYTTLEFKVNCVRAIRPDIGTMRCTGRIVHRGRTTATSEASLFDEAGKLYAHGSETCLVFPAQ